MDYQTDGPISNGMPVKATSHHHPKFPNKPHSKSGRSEATLGNDGGEKELYLEHPTKVYILWAFGNSSTLMLQRASHI